MIQIRTRPKNTRPLSSMRVSLNSPYSMRAQISAQTNGQSENDLFSYQQGQHRIIKNRQPHKTNGDGREEMPEEVKITKTADGKRWITSRMEVELAKDILEVRDGLGKLVDAAVIK